MKRLQNRKLTPDEVEKVQKQMKEKEDEELMQKQFMREKNDAIMRQEQDEQEREKQKALIKAKQDEQDRKTIQETFASNPNIVAMGIIRVKIPRKTHKEPETEVRDDQAAPSDRGVPSEDKKTG